MDATPVVPAAHRLLRDQFRRDARRRESTVAGFLAVMAGLSGLISLALIPIVGVRLGLALFAVMALVLAWYGTVWLRLRRGHFHPVLPWLHVAAEVSIPTVIFALDTRFHGAEYALSAPPLVMWGALIVLAGLRMNRTLAVAAGALAAAEYLALYAFVILPALPDGTLVTFSPAFIAIRAFFLVATGGVTALVAHHLLEKADEALRVVRERDLFGKYLLHERIGAGGMAEVFRATYSPEGGFEKQVAVKRILPEYAGDPTFAQLFRREAHLGSMLQHPNVVQILDLGVHRGSLFLAMEFVDGLTLRKVLNAQRGRPLPLRAVTYLASELASALDYIHARLGPDGAPLGLVHRDVNPPNVLVSRFGEVKLADFGVARAQSAEPLTRGDIVRGKAGYMAPEQLAGAQIDGRVDLFALGLTMWEALTGRPVHDGPDDEARLRALDRPVRAPSELRREIPRELDAIVLSLVELDPRRRAATGALVRKALLALPEEAAPLPDGRTELMRALQEAEAEYARARALAEKQAAALEAQTDTLPDVPRQTG